MARAWARNKLYVNVVLAPSLSYVDLGYEKLAVVNEEDLVKLILRYKKMPSLRFAPAPPVAPPLPDAAGASSSATGDGPPVVPVVPEAPSSSLVLPAGRLEVTSSIAALYGMKMRDVDLGRFSVQSDEVVRFRSSDDKVVLTDILVCVCEDEFLEDAQEAMWTLIRHDDVKIRDLDSLEVVLDDRVRYADSLEVVPDKVRCHHCQLVPSANASMSSVLVLTFAPSTGEGLDVHILSRPAQVLEPPRRAPRQCGNRIQSRACPGWPWWRCGRRFVAARRRRSLFLRAW
jgi:hypothetical protein